MPGSPRILVLDDELDVLELYQEMLKTLPSKPEVTTCESGQRALALLETEQFNMLISDLQMPKMDGLQVLSIVRHKYPQLIIVVMTAILDESLRKRAYDAGVDLFWQKPSTAEDTKLFLESIEALLSRQAIGGFRGVAVKTLSEILQMEGHAMNSLVLKVTNNRLEGRIWIVDGNVIDAAVGDQTGLDALKTIYSWKSGSFESLPAETTRVRTIFYGNMDGLLLDLSQTVDEVQAAGTADVVALENVEGGGQRLTPLQASAKVEGVEFVLSAPKDTSKAVESYGVANPEPLAQWTRQTVAGFQELAAELVLGELKEIEGRGTPRHVTIVPLSDRLLCIGLNRKLSAAKCRETVETVLTKWAS